MYHIKCHLWPVRLYDILTDNLKNGKTFGKAFFEHTVCVLIFSAPLYVIFLILKIIQPNTIAILVPRLSCEAPVILVEFWREKIPTTILAIS